MKIQDYPLNDSILEEDPDPSPVIFFPILVFFDRND